MKGKILIAGVGSGSGKTTITYAVLTELVRRGNKVVSFKCGPDYIDPMFHRKAIGSLSYNLDSFFLGETSLRCFFDEKSADGDYSVAEGVMGYYDGAGYTTSGSTYEIATIIDAPVILVVNGRGMGNSILAMIKGFCSYVPKSMIKGIILNQVSQGTYEKLKPLIERENLVVCGFAPRLNEELTIKSRHLGLYTPESVDNIKEKLSELSKVICKTVDVDKIIELSERADNISDNNYAPGNKNETVKKVNLAVARDEAFSFIYQENLELLEKNGCIISYFSPIHDSMLPQNIDGMLIMGGYPELYAKDLSGNISMRDDIKKCIEDGMPVLAECGGYMYLKEYIEDSSKNMYQMVGVLKGSCTKKDRLVRFGYVTLTAKSDNLLLKKGESIKGHEFHYWDCEENGDAFVAHPAGERPAYDCIVAKDNLMAGFAHMYYLSNPEAVKNFVAKCSEYRENCRSKNGID